MNEDTVEIKKLRKKERILLGCMIIEIIILSFLILFTSIAIGADLNPSSFI